jgi:poly-gamma-glutamate synthesis protein (capsule biosynthesis protein)
VVIGLLLALAATLAAARDDDAAVSIAFVGDIMLDDGPGKALARGVDPFAAFAAHLAGADLRIGNLECVVATQGSAEPGKPYAFRAHPRSLAVVKRHFDAVSLANNHSGDYGPEAFRQMLALLEARQLPYFGGGADLARAHAPLVLERRGLRIAFLGYNEFFPRSFEADFDKPGIAWSEDEQLRLDIERARRQYRADLVIPFMHWGWEHELVAGPRQRQLARLLIDAGADAVVGGHPHVTQDIEHYRGKPIFYSLGNFVFDGFSDKDNNTGWLLRLEVDRQGVKGWRTVVARIDRRGIPHPRPSTEGLCWQRGEADWTACRD